MCSVYEVTCEYIQRTHENIVSLSETCVLKVDFIPFCEVTFDDQWSQCENIRSLSENEKVVKTVCSVCEVTFEYNQSYWENIDSLVNIFDL